MTHWRSHAGLSSLQMSRTKKEVGRKNRKFLAPQLILSPLPHHLTPTTPQTTYFPHEPSPVVLRASPTFPQRCTRLNQDILVATQLTVNPSSRSPTLFCSALHPLASPALLTGLPLVVFFTSGRAPPQPGDFSRQATHTQAIINQPISPAPAAPTQKPCAPHPEITGIHTLPPR